MRVGPAAARQGASFGSSDYLSWHGNDDLPERVGYLMSNGTLGGVRAIRLPPSVGLQFLFRGAWLLVAVERQQVEAQSCPCATETRRTCER